MREEAGWHQGGYSGMRGSGRGTWKERGVLAFLRELSLQCVRCEASTVQVYTGRRLPSSPSPRPRQLTYVQLSLQPLLPCQMRDDLDVDKIFVLSWL